MSYQDVKRIHTEMALREPLADALKALDKNLRNLGEYETPLENKTGVEGVTGKTFQTDFASFCFHIATGVGKTRLLGACIAYLYRTQGWTDFFILVPGSTIYNKFKGRDFVRGGGKFLFAGLGDFPDFNLITADNFRQVTQTGLFDAPINIYLFNIGKIFEGRNQRQFKFSKEDADGLGLAYPEGFASYLAERRPVILMDEAHRYYAPASLSAMNRLKPRLGLEFTATPTHSGNIISRFHLGQAIDAGYVKRPRVTHVVNDDTPDNEKDQQLLLDAAFSHERKKGVLNAYCQNNSLPPVKPILLITAADTEEGDTIAAYLKGHTQRIGKDGSPITLYDGQPFGAGTALQGRYADKVLLVHSKTEDDTDQAVKELESGPYEIVVHVNKLKEGLDVSTIYTLAVLRSSTSSVLTEQIIGRGLRLPFGEPVPEGADTPEDVEDLNALDIMPHKEYAKIVAEADNYLQGRILERKIDRKDKAEGGAVMETVAVQPLADDALQIRIPLIASEVQGTHRRMGAFPIVPGVALTGDADYARRLDFDDLRTRTTTMTQEFGPAPLTDAVAYLVRAADDGCAGIDQDDFPILKTLAQEYLFTLRPDKDTWPYAIALRRKTIQEDFLAQIRAQLDTLHPTVQVRREGTFEFKSWTKSVPTGYVAPPRADNDPAQEKVGVLIGGYAKSLYPSNVLDSKHEKWLADCLERDTAVLRWVRLPNKQLRIGLSRSGYYPDFVAVVRGSDSSERHYLLEVKAANKCDPTQPDPDVRAKYLAAQDWVAQANRDGTSGDWRYCLLPDKEVEARRGSDFFHTIDGARHLSKSAL